MFFRKNSSGLFIRSCAAGIEMVPSSANDDVFRSLSNAEALDERVVEKKVMECTGRVTICVGGG